MVSTGAIVYRHRCDRAGRRGRGRKALGAINKPVMRAQSGMVMWGEITCRVRQTGRGRETEGRGRYRAMHDIWWEKKKRCIHTVRVCACIPPVTHDSWSIDCCFHCDPANLAVTTDVLYSTLITAPPCPEVQPHTYTTSTQWNPHGLCRKVLPQSTASQGSSIALSFNASASMSHSNSSIKLWTDSRLSEPNLFYSPKFWEQILLFSGCWSSSSSSSGSSSSSSKWCKKVKKFFCGMHTINFIF